MAWAAESTGPIGNDTLWTVARKVNQQRHLGTIAQVAWALYRANPQAFEGAPGSIKAGSSLAIPAAADVISVPAAEAFERVTGKAVAAGVPAVAKAAVPAAKPAAAALPATAPQPQVEAPVALPPPLARSSNPHAPPEVLGIELKPVVAGKQSLGVIGANFRPGAKVDLHDMLNGTTFSALPARVGDGRLDLSAAVGKAQSNWLITVHNADGTHSEPYGFAAGPGAGSTWPDAAATEAFAAQAREREAAQNAAAEKAAAEQAAADKAADDKAATAAGAIVDKAALDREFEEKMTADRAAYEKTEAEKARQARTAKRR